MSAVKKFYSILKHELEDVEEDILALMAVYEHRREAGEITEYVYKSNAATFRREMSSIAEIVRELADDSTHAPGDLGAAETHLMEMIRKSVKDYDFPKAVLDLCQRKIQKVRRFVEV